MTRPLSGIILILAVLLFVVPLIRILMHRPAEPVRKPPDDAGGRQVRLTAPAPHG